MTDKGIKELEEIITDIYMKDRIGHMGARNMLKEARFLELCKHQIIEVITKDLDKQKDTA